MTYQEAFEILTDWFHEYHDGKGSLVRERRMTDEYKEAVKVVSEALCKLMGLEKRIENGEFIAPFKYKRGQIIYGLPDSYYLPNSNERTTKEVYGVFFMLDGQPKTIETFHKEDLDEMFEKVKEKHND